MNLEEMEGVLGFEEQYKMDKNGWIYSVARNGTKGGLLKPRKNKWGYPYVVLSKNDRAYTRKMHRLVAIQKVHNPNPEVYEYVNHKDGDKGNFHPNNLEWVTQRQNIHHSWAMGLSFARKGAENPLSKLTNKQRWDIVCEYATTVTKQADLAKKHGVSQPLIALVVRSFLRDCFIQQAIDITKLNKDAK